MYIYLSILWLLDRNGACMEACKDDILMGVQRFQSWSSAIFRDRGSILAMNIVTWWHYCISPCCNS